MKIAVSVDLDEIRHYEALHGLVSQEPAHAVYTRAIPRLASWALERRIPLTWFVVGRDLEHSPNAELTSGLLRAGHELGCHTYSHFYDLTRRPIGIIRAEIEHGIAAVEQVGTKVFGFRAPGYVVTDTLLQLLSECGLAYDSSVFPCPPYYALKAAAVAARRARNGSQAILDLPEVLRAPTQPYRVGRPYWYRGSGILEIPVQVTRRARWPFIGTTLTLGGKVGAKMLARGVLGEPLVNLELHGIDALDASDGLASLANLQPGLAKPWGAKLQAIDAAVEELRSHGYQPVTMHALAEEARSQL